MAHPYSSRNPSTTAVDIPRDDSRQYYSSRFTLPPLEYPSDRPPPPPNSSKCNPNGSDITLPALHSHHQPYHSPAYPPAERAPVPPQTPPHMHSPAAAGQTMKYPPPTSNGSTTTTTTTTPFEFRAGKTPPNDSRQIRKIGQRRDTPESRKPSSITSSNNDNTSTHPPQNHRSSPPPFTAHHVRAPPNDPYLMQSGSQSAILLRSPSPELRDLRKRPSTGALPRPKEQKVRNSTGLGIADLIRPDSSRPQPTYALHMRQQPLAARACGFGERDRRVVDPPPILELRITPPVPSSSASSTSTSTSTTTATTTPSDETARRLRYPYYVVHCSLWDASRDTDSGAMDGPDGTSGSNGTSGGGERRNQQRRLMGTLVASPFVGKDERGVEGCFFCFPDLSCRTTGRYRLRFVLMVLDPATMRRGTRVPFSASATSDVVTVYAAKDFPGMQASTPLTRRLKEQGCLISVKKGIEKIGERGGESEDEAGGRKGALIVG